MTSEPTCTACLLEELEEQSAYEVATAEEDAREAAKLLGELREAEANLPAQIDALLKESAESINELLNERCARHE